VSKVPPMTAKASLYMSSQHYRTWGRVNQIHQRAVRPAQRGRTARFDPIDRECYAECLCMCRNATVDVDDPGRRPLDCEMGCTAMCWLPWF
jgi:hypothetical protein